MGKIGGKIGETRKVIKASLTLPLDSGLSWPVIEKYENKCIIEEMKNELPKVVSMRPSSSKKKHSKRKQGSSVRSRVIGNDLMLVGVNAVTKTLEKEPLLLVMVCKSAKPISMTHHLISLCAIRDTPACCINGLSCEISSIFGLRSVLAIGFKDKPNHTLQDLVDFIKDKIPQLAVPWVNVWKKGLPSSTETENCPSEGSGKDDELKDKVIGVKSKNEDYGDSSPKIDSDGKNCAITGEKKVGCQGEILSIETEQERSSGFQMTRKNATVLKPAPTETVNEATNPEKSKRERKRKIEDVAYTLLDTNFKFKEVDVKIKKKSKQEE